MTQQEEMYYAIKEAIQVLEKYDTGEDFAIFTSLRRLREIEQTGINTGTAQASINVIM